MAVIETSRLILRQWRTEDRLHFADMNADPEVMEHFVSTLDREASDAMADLGEKHLRDHGWGLWATEVKDGPAFIGFIGLWQPNFEAHFMPAIEVGWRLARPAWGQGYAPEGAAAVLDFAFDHLGLTDIVSMTTIGNAKSRRVMEKLGLTHDSADDFDHPRVPDGPLRRHVLYRTTAPRWSAIQARRAAESGL